MCHIMRLSLFITVYNMYLSLLPFSAYRSESRNKIYYSIKKCTIGRGKTQASRPVRLRGPASQYFLQLRTNPLSYLCPLLLSILPVCDGSPVFCCGEVYVG